MGLEGVVHTGFSKSLEPLLLGEPSMGVLPIVGQHTIGLYPSPSCSKEPLVCLLGMPGVHQCPWLQTCLIEEVHCVEVLPVGCMHVGLRAYPRGHLQARRLPKHLPVQGILPEQSRPRRTTF